jgi:hypothetical protein
VAKKNAAVRGTEPTGTPEVRLLDMKRAAEYVGLSFWTLREMVIAGQVPHVQFKSPRSGVGRPLRRVLIDRNDLDALIERSRAGGAAA